MSKEFDFGSSVKNQLPPAIPHEAFSKLEEGTILEGKVLGISSFNGITKAIVEINGGRYWVPLWDWSVADATGQYRNAVVSVLYKGMNDKGYPAIYIM